MSRTLLSPEAAAAELGVSRAVLEGFIRSGSVRVLRSGRARYISNAEIERHKTFTPAEPGEFAALLADFRALRVELAELRAHLGVRDG